MIATVKPHHKCCQCDSLFENGQKGYMLYSYLCCSMECLNRWVHIGQVEVEIQIDANGDDTE